MYLLQSVHDKLQGRIMFSQICNYNRFILPRPRLYRDITENTALCISCVVVMYCFCYLNVVCVKQKEPLEKL